MSCTIVLQLIDGYFYPTDSISRDLLVDNYHIERIPEWRFNIENPKMVHDGFRLAVTGYEPIVYEKPDTPLRETYWEPELVENPCIKCYLRGLCDDDDCGRKYKKRL